MEGALSDFLEALQKKSLNDLVRNTYGGATLLDGFKNDMECINVILTTKSDKRLFESITKLCKLYHEKYDKDYSEKSLHYIQSKSYTDKIVSAYGGCFYGKAVASNIQRRIHETLAFTVKESRNYALNNPNQATLQAYEEFMKATL